MKDDAENLDSIRRSWKGTSVDSVLRMHLGPVASGAAVLADNKTVAGIVNQNRKLLAVDMETYGVYAACQEATIPQPKAFSMKSICDFADKNKSDDHQRYASFTSASAMKSFVEKYL